VRAVVEPLALAGRLARVTISDLELVEAGWVEVR
jgi:hypothetical protein